MNNYQEFQVKVNGTIYNAICHSHMFNVFMSGRKDDGTFASRTIVDAFGYCNPLATLWSSLKYQTTYGAARSQMEKKCVRDAVIREIEMHKQFCLDQITEGE